MLSIHTAVSLLALFAMTASTRPIFIHNGQEIDVVTIWQQANRTGDKMGLCDLNKCLEFPPGNEWNNAISSMMVTGGYTCTAWGNSNCAGTPMRSDIRGAFDDLRADGMDNMIGSLMCRQFMD